MNDEIRKMDLKELCSFKNVIEDRIRKLYQIVELERKMKTFDECQRQLDELLQTINE